MCNEIASKWGVGTPVVQEAGPVPVAMMVMSSSPLAMEMMPSNFVPVGRQVVMFREAGIDGCTLEVCQPVGLLPLALLH